MHEACPGKSPRFHSDRTQIFLRTTDVESLMSFDGTLVHGKSAEVEST